MEKRGLTCVFDNDTHKKTMHSGGVSVGEHLENDLVTFIDGLRDTNHDVTVGLSAFEVINLDPEFKDGKHGPH
jgi:hypothetical protein